MSEENKIFNSEVQKVGAIPKNSGKHKIARIVVSDKQYKLCEDNGVWRLKPILGELKNVLTSFVQEAYLKNMKFEFVITPGGFLDFEWPSQFAERIDNDTANSKENLQIFYNAAELKINEFFNQLSKEIFDKLKETADYFTIGIDSTNYNNGQHIELVAVFDLKKQKVIHWTGKFYPTEEQKRDLIRINDLSTHFIQLNNQKIVILGCHDLNAFNPRGQANANPEGWKRKIATEFKKRCQEFEPDIILQHPHTTDTPNIWMLAWKAVEKELPSVKHYASGIKYYNYDGPPRAPLTEVLKKTKKGDVVGDDFSYVKEIENENVKNIKTEGASEELKEKFFEYLDTVKDADEIMRKHYQDMQLIVQIDRKDLGYMRYQFNIGNDIYSAIIVRLDVDKKQVVITTLYNSALPLEAQKLFDESVVKYYFKNKTDNCIPKLIETRQDGKLIGKTYVVKLM